MSIVSPVGALNPYSSNPAPVGNFQAVYRKENPEMRRRRMIYYAESLATAEAEGKPEDVKLFSDLLANIVMAMRAELAQQKEEVE